MPTFLDPEEIYSLVCAAAREVWVALHEGTTLPYIAVMGNIGEEGRLRLDVVECSGPKSADDIILFDGGAPLWKEIVFEILGAVPDLDASSMSEEELRQYWEVRLSQVEDWEFEDLSDRIWDHLVDDDWLRKHGFDIPANPEDLLAELVDERDFVPAAALAHALLLHLAHDPARNTALIIDLCAILAASPDHSQYEAAVLCGLQALSRSLNLIASESANQRHPLPDGILKAHRRLENWPIINRFPSGFVHIPDPIITAMLL